MEDPMFDVGDGLVDIGCSSNACAASEASASSPRGLLIGSWLEWDISSLRKPGETKSPDGPSSCKVETPESNNKAEVSPLSIPRGDRVDSSGSAGWLEPKSSWIGSSPDTRLVNSSGFSVP